MNTKDASPTHQRTAAIVVAAGASRRMNGVDKVFAEVAGRPLLAHSIQVLDDSPEVNDIVLVLAPGSINHARRLVADRGWHKVREVCQGGERRQDSVRNGLERVSDAEWVMIHDGARPCLDRDMLLRGLKAANETGAAIAAVPVKDTIKVVSEDNNVVDTPARDRLWAVQTPQIFRRTLLTRAHEEVREDVTDDARMVERIGGTVKVFMGSYENIKVTTPGDLAIVEAFLQHRAPSVAGPTR